VNDHDFFRPAENGNVAVAVGKSNTSIDRSDIARDIASRSPIVRWLAAAAASMVGLEVFTRRTGATAESSPVSAGESVKNV
jgi:hypothetical protein